MSVETHRVLMGACGWNHKAWLNDFYSDDLPEDWQLGFYANEFPVVYVPAADWLNVIDIAEWTEDISDSFRFILEISDDVLNDELRFAAALEQVKTLGGFCLGLVFQLTPSICSNTRLLQKHLEIAQAMVPVCVELNGSEFTDAFKQILLKQNISEVWDGISPIDDSLKRGTIAITHIIDENVDMKNLRVIIEGCLTASNEDCISVLCLDGDPPSLELLRNAEILLNLL
jgi:uncharacterized protein YecE (DUF72 family)